MKRLGWTLGILAAGLVQAASPGLPTGSYAGTATWRGPSDSAGTYTAERAFSGNTMTSRFRWTEPKPREEQITITLAMKGSDPMFDVLDATGQSVGKGYCYEDVCAYHATFGPVMMDESFRWGNGAMEVVGAKSGPGFEVAWKETLKAR